MMIQVVVKPFISGDKEHELTNQGYWSLLL